MRLRRKRLPADADAAALWWAGRRQIDPRSFAQDKTFAEWLGDPENAAAWAEIERRIDGIGAFATMPEVRDMRQAALAAIRQRRSTSKYIGLGSAALAASVLLALLWAVSWTQMPGQRADAPSRPPVKIASPARYATAVGEQRDVLLTDGTTIALNTASIIEVRYTSARRDVTLLTGQALFQVAPDQHRPFVVTAGSRVITATGTAFDVEVRDDGDVNVLLVEGHIRVEPLRSRGLARLVPALDRTELDPGQRLVVPLAGTDTVAVADVERELAWRRGILIFRNDSLAQAIAEVNRYSSTQIVATDPRIGALKVSGVFPTTRSEDFLAALQNFHPVSVERVSAATIALRWRDDAAP